MDGKEDVVRQIENNSLFALLSNRVKYSGTGRIIWKSILADASVHGIVCSGMVKG
jgi:hypothetical protein